MAITMGTGMVIMPQITTTMGTTLIIMATGRTAEVPIVLQTTPGQMVILIPKGQVRTKPAGQI